jgi:hypothetical protein
MDYRWWFGNPVDGVTRRLRSDALGHVAFVSPLWHCAAHGATVTG